MKEQLLYNQSELLIGIVTLALLIVFVEIGFRIGRKAKVEITESMRTQTSTIQTAILTLL